MRLRTLLSIAIGAASLSLAAAPSSATEIVLNQWYTGHFVDNGTALLGGAQVGGLGLHGPLPGGLFGDAIDAPDAPWEITLLKDAVLIVADAEIAGDRFDLFDNGQPIGMTSTPLAYDPNNLYEACNANAILNLEQDIACALADVNYSSGSFVLQAGPHSITGIFLGSVSQGDFNFSVQHDVPAPGVLAMLALGLAGVAGRRRIA